MFRDFVPVAGGARFPLRAALIKATLWRIRHALTQSADCGPPAIARGNCFPNSSFRTRFDSRANVTGRREPEDSRMRLTALLRAGLVAGLVLASAPAAFAPGN